MAFGKRISDIPFLVIVGLAGWLVPGAGYLLIKEKKRALVVFFAIAITFCIGIYIGSIGVIDPIKAKPWYIAQILNTPFVALIGHLTASGNYPVYGKANEIGQIYTSITGLLNLLTIINAVYLAYAQKCQSAGD